MLTFTCSLLTGARDEASVDRPALSRVASLTTQSPGASMLAHRFPRAIIPYLCRTFRRSDLRKRLIYGGRYWDRTSGPCRVKAAESSIAVHGGRTCHPGYGGGSRPVFLPSKAPHAPPEHCAGTIPHHFLHHLTHRQERELRGQREREDPSYCRALPPRSRRRGASSCWDTEQGTATPLRTLKRCCARSIVRSVLGS